MRYFFIITIVMFLSSCLSESKRNNDMEQLLKSYARDSLNIQNIIGEDMFFFHSSYKIKNGKLIAGGMRDKERTSDNYTSLIFVIDLESKKLISTIEDPEKHYYDLVFEMIDDSTLFYTHILRKEEIYLANIFNKNIEKKNIQFGSGSSSPAIIDANGKQLFMTCNVYGFTIANLDKLEVKVFDNSSFNVSQSVVSYPIDATLNLLSGTFEYDPKFSENHRKSITIYAIDDESKVKWKKALPFIKYDFSDAFYFYNYGSYFIIKYHNAVECLNKENGKTVWSFINEHPISQTFMVGNKLVVHSFFDSLKMAPSDDEKWNEKMKEGYRDQLKIIDLENGKILWRERFMGTYSHLGILENNLIVYNSKNAFILNLEKMQEQPMKQTMDLDQSSFENIMDTKTGKLFLNYNGTLYW